MIELRAEKELWFTGVRLYGREARNPAQTYAMQPAVFTTVEAGQLIEPFLTLTASEAQTLMDSLYSCGLRPSDGAGSAGALAATQRHLDDMRRLIFDKD